MDSSIRGMLVQYLKKQKLTEEEFQKYLDYLDEYYFQKRKETFENGGPNNFYINERKKLYKYVLRPLLVAQKSLSGFKVIVDSDERVEVDRPKIFAVTHIGKYDIEIVMQALKEHTFVLLGDAKYMYNTLDGFFIEMNGVIYLNVYNKEDCHIAKTTVIKILQQGGNVMWYIEGIWNTSPNRIVLPFPYGIIEAALRSNAVIIPVAIEQYDKLFALRIGKHIDINAGKSFYANEKQFKMDISRELKDELATLKWLIWEKYGRGLRQDIPNDYHEKYVEGKIAEWPFFTKEEIEKRVFKEPGIVDSKEVFEPLLHLDYNKKNAFLLKGQPKIKKLKL